MDFDDTPEEAAFRAEARAWLQANAREKSGDTDFARHYHTAVVDEGAEAAHVRRCKQWQNTLYRGGWAGITWPKEYGGRGASAMEAMIFNREQAAFDVSAGVFSVGIGMAGPTIIAHGTDAQKARWLDPLLRGDKIWCQLFSEPGAGSDLAGLSTRAERDGDEWVVNGQKVWTSGAHYSDLGILLARTDPDAPKHRGITYFVVDMSTPGIDVRPLRQATGRAHFNEVFVTDVRIAHDDIVGEVNGGWGVALTTLANERALIGGGGGMAFPDLVRLARELGRTSDALSRQDLVDAFIRFEVLKYLGYRVQTAISQGRMPGPESSVLKLAYSRHVARTGNLGLALEGAQGMLLESAPHHGFWQQQFLNQWSIRIGGGTDEVQRNVIGERVLGLPREPRVDKDIPFRELTRMPAG
jgi:alkylation response protein AidB-like acyl-CoA dehydrogenase